MKKLLTLTLVFAAVALAGLGVAQQEGPQKIRPPKQAAGGCPSGTRLIAKDKVPTSCPKGQKNFLANNAKNLEPGYVCATGCRDVEVDNPDPSARPKKCCECSCNPINRGCNGCI